MYKIIGYDSIKYNSSGFQRNFDTKIIIPAVVESVNIYSSHAYSLQPNFQLDEQHGHLQLY